MNYSKRFLMRRSALLGSALICLVGMLPVAFAATQTATFQQGVDEYSGMRYNTIRAGSAGHNYGSSPTMALSSNRSGQGVESERFNILLGFDLNSLSGSGATVESATITLTVGSIAINDNDMNARFMLEGFELKRDWIQGSSNNSNGVSNWNYRMPNQPWEIAGAQGSADRSDTAFWTSGDYRVSDLSAGDTIIITLSNDVVQSWIDNPSDNYGIVLTMMTYTMWRYPTLSFHSGIADDATLRPLLTVNYSSIPEAGNYAVALGVASLVALIFVHRRRLR